MAEKKCMECERRVRGRADKKFCSAICRNTYHNRKNGYTTHMVRKINKVLRRNRAILLQYGPMGKTSISGKQLSARGFDFQYYTSRGEDPNGKAYYFCYDQGYVMEGEDRYLLIEQKEPRD